ncbi:MAG: hypothetical protein KA163_01005 [Bacteroidia bacterium]|nr:hypothetical protein [Bacteroidia bacterium]
MKTILPFSLAFLCLLFIYSCSDNEFENTSVEGVNLDLSGEIVYACPSCLITDENDPSNSYGRIDSISQYGFGVYYTLPDSLKDCTLKLILTGKMRETESISGYLAVALHSTDSIYHWGYVFSEHHLKELNKWGEFKDSVIIPRQANKPSSRLLKIFQFKTTGKGAYDVDQLNVKIIRQ